MSSFLDSNVLLYLLDITSAKRPLALQLARRGGVISVQVLNEFADVARRKFHVSFADVSASLAPIKEVFRVVPVTLDVHDLAWEIASTYRLRIYDACIVAAADLAGCDALYTEDLNHGKRIGRVTVCNPFTDR